VHVYKYYKLSVGYSENGMTFGGSSVAAEIHTSTTATTEMMVSNKRLRGCGDLCEVQQK